MNEDVVVPLDIDVTVLLNEKAELTKALEQEKTEHNKVRGQVTRLTNELLEVQTALERSRQAPPPSTQQIQLQTEWENREKEKYMKGYKDRDTENARLRQLLEAKEANNTTKAEEKAFESTNKQLLKEKEALTGTIKEALWKIEQGGQYYFSKAVEQLQKAVGVWEEPDKEDDEEEDEEQEPEPEPEPQHRNIITTTKKVIRKITKA